jgi:hypothetical protein
MGLGRALGLGATVAGTSAWASRLWVASALVADGIGGSGQQVNRKWVSGSNTILECLTFTKYGLKQMRFRLTVSWDRIELEGATLLLTGIFNQANLTLLWNYLNPKN